MSLKFKKYALVAGISLMSFCLSLLEFGNAYFVASLPFSLSCLISGELYFFAAFIGLILSSFFIGNYYIVLSLSYLLITLLVLIIFRKSALSLVNTFLINSAILGAFFAVFSINFLKFSLSFTIQPIFTMCLLTYFMSKFSLEMKSKDKFSLTHGEVVFIFTLLNMVILKMKINLFEINLSFVLVSLIIYLVCRVHTKAGILTCFATIVFIPFANTTYLKIMILAILIFLIKIISSYKKTGAFLYCSIILLLSAIFKNYDFILSSIVVGVCVILLKNSLFIHIQGFVVDPKDYRIIAYKEKYNELINKNKTINFLMEAVENKIKNNPHMKRKNSEKILESLDFLTKRIKSEEDVDYKKALLEQFEYLGMDVICMKMDFDGEECLVKVSLRDFKDYKKLLVSIEEILKKRMKLANGKYNFLTNSTTYTFINKSDYSFDYYIKQRSVDVRCGDNYMCFSTKNKKYFLISDGMGHGEKASEESKFALFLLRKFIELGMGTEDAIKNCNNLVYTNNDSYNTLDLLEYDCFTNEIVLYKNGSGSSYIQYKDNVDNLMSENLPLGIIDEVGVTRIIINDNVERIVLTSDGIKLDISKIIKESKNKSLKEMVEKIFDGEEIYDDQTIMAINIIKS